MPGSKHKQTGKKEDVSELHQNSGIFEHVDCQMNEIEKVERNLI